MPTPSSAYGIHKIYALNEMLKGYDSPEERKRVEKIFWILDSGEWLVLQGRPMAFFLMPTCLSFFVVLIGGNFLSQTFWQGGFPPGSNTIGWISGVLIALFGIWLAFVICKRKFDALVLKLRQEASDDFGMQVIKEVHRITPGVHAFSKHIRLD